MPTITPKLAVLTPRFPPHLVQPPPAKKPTTAARPDTFEAQSLSLRKNPDLAFDGMLVGAGGKVAAPGTPLDQIAGVTPADGRAPTETILYVNGMQTTKDVQAKSLQAIADLTGGRLIGVHNSTGGFAADAGQSIADKLDLGANPAAASLTATVLSELRAGHAVHLMAHSQGGIVVARALGAVQRALVSGGMTQAQAEAAMGAIKVETFGAASLRYPDGPRYVHYVNDADVVPTMFGLGNALGLGNPGRGAVIRHFSERTDQPFGAHDFDAMYLKYRVPFDEARR